MTPIASLAESIINLLLLTIVAHALLSWLIIAGVRNDAVKRLYVMIGMALEPLYQPLRKVIPSAGLVDFTPLAAIIALVILGRMIRTFA